MIIRLKVPDNLSSTDPNKADQIKRHIAGVLRGRGRREHVRGLLNLVSTGDDHAPLDIEVEAEPPSTKSR